MVSRPGVSQWSVSSAYRASSATRSIPISTPTFRSTGSSATDITRACVSCPSSHQHSELKSAAYMLANTRRIHWKLGFSAALHIAKMEHVGEILNEVQQNRLLGPNACFFFSVETSNSRLRICHHIKDWEICSKILAVLTSKAPGITSLRIAMTSGDCMVGHDNLDAINNMLSLPGEHFCRLPAPPSTLLSLPML